MVGILWLTTHNRTFKVHVKKFLVACKRALEIETEETKQMIQIYLRSAHGAASKEELRIAHKQFRDLLKSLGLGALLILPFAPLSLPLVISIGKRLGIDILPSFMKREEEKSPDSKI